MKNNKLYTSIAEFKQSQTKTKIIKETNMSIPTGVTDRLEDARTIVYGLQLISYDNKKISSGDILSLPKSIFDVLKQILSNIDTIIEKQAKNNDYESVYNEYRVYLYKLLNAYKTIPNLDFNIPNLDIDVSRHLDLKDYKRVPRYIPTPKFESYTAESKKINESQNLSIQGNSRDWLRMIEVGNKAGYDFVKGDFKSGDIDKFAKLVQKQINASKEPKRTSRYEIASQLLPAVKKLLTK